MDGADGLSNIEELAALVEVKTTHIYNDSFRHPLMGCQTYLCLGPRDNVVENVVCVVHEI